ncbi:MAG: HAD-IC family P-type ATPase, partial [Pseudomonadota bacterium]
QIVALMEQASLEKPRLAQLADRVARPFLWFVLIAAAAAASFWWSTDPSRALMAAVAVLVVTCPCALSLATPTAMLTSAGLLARHGVLVRRLQAIESLADIDTVIFDKTGTLTEAHMGLRSVQTRAGVSEADALALAYQLARHSLHPVSRALLAASGEHALASGQLQDVKEVAGQGLEGRIESPGSAFTSGLLRLGSARFCGLEGWARDGVQVYLADSQGWIARFELGESIRPDAVEAIAALQAAGLAVHLLSGDRQASAQQMAECLGIRHVQGDCTPEAKLDRLRVLQQQG